MPWILGSCGATIAVTIRIHFTADPLWKQSAFTVWWPSSLASTKEQPIKNHKNLWFGIWSYLIYSGHGEKCCPWVQNIWKPGFRIAPEGVLRPNGRQQAATLPWHFRDLERASGMIGMWKQVGIIPREHVFSLLWKVSTHMNPRSWKTFSP